MKKYKYYNNTNGVVQSATRNSITNKVEVVVKVSSGQLGVSTSEVYPITFMAMDDTLFTGFSESCTYNASTDEYTLFFPGTSISEDTIAKFMYPSAEWELRVTQTELNELFNEVYQLTGNLVTTPEITGPDAPIVYQGTYANEYSFTASPTLAGNTISSFLVDVSGIGTQVITAADNAGTYTLKIPTTISAGTKLDMYVTATDSQGWKSSPAYKQLTVVAPYIKVPTVVKPTEGQEVIAINFDIQSSTFAAEGLEDTCSKTEFQIQNSSGTTVYTKELTGATYTATITDANLQRGVLYRIRCRQFGTTLTTPSAWSDFVSFRTADIYIQAPTVISPVTGNQIFKYNVVVSGDPFAVVGGETDTHTASQYRVQNVLGTNIYDSGEKTDALTSITIPELTEAVVGETYKISMRYKGATYGWSDWSTDVTVSIKSAYVNAPVLTAPTQNAQIKGTTVAFVQQGFATTGTSDTQTGVQYQLLAADNSVYYDSGELTTDYSAHTATISKPSLEIALRARARNKGANLGWSAWSEYVNITVSPNLHLSLSADGNYLYVGKPDGSPFDRPDGTYYWLQISTTTPIVDVSSGQAILTSAFDMNQSRGVYIYDTTDTGSTTSCTISELRSTPSLIDTKMCALGSTQDGEYTTFRLLAAGVPSTGDAKQSNNFILGRNVGLYKKYSHILSKRELLYLLIQEEDINSVMGETFFSEHIANTAGKYNVSCTMRDSVTFWLVKRIGSSLLCYTNPGTSTVRGFYTPFVVTLNCDELGNIFPDKHLTEPLEDSSYTYFGYDQNTPLFDYYGHRFWAGVSKNSVTGSLTESMLDKVAPTDILTKNKLNLTTKDSRGSYVQGIYPFQLHASSIADAAWFVTTKPTGSLVGTKKVYIASPLALISKFRFFSADSTTYYSGSYAGVSTRLVLNVQQAASALVKNVSSASFTSSNFGTLPYYKAFYEYLPVSTGRKLYRHDSGMGTVMEYTDADGVRKSVIILDGSYTSTAAMNTSGTYPNLLDELITDTTGTIVFNILNTNTINRDNDSTKTTTDAFLNLLWPVNNVDSNSSAYNTNQWRALGEASVAATAANSIKIGGVGCQVPNMNVAMRIYLERNALDALDPTVITDPTKALGETNPKGVFGASLTKSMLTSSLASTTQTAGATIVGTGAVGTEGISYATMLRPVLELAA